MCRKLPMKQLATEVWNAYRSQSCPILLASCHRHWRTFSYQWRYQPRYLCRAILIGKKQEGLCSLIFRSVGTSSDRPSLVRLDFRPHFGFEVAGSDRPKEHKRVPNNVQNHLNVGIVIISYELTWKSGASETPSSHFKLLLLRIRYWIPTYVDVVLSPLS